MGWGCQFPGSSGFVGHAIEAIWGRIWPIWSNSGLKILVAAFCFSRCARDLLDQACLPLQFKKRKEWRQQTTGAADRFENVAYYFASRCIRGPLLVLSLAGRLAWWRASMALAGLLLIHVWVCKENQVALTYSCLCLYVSEGIRHLLISSPAKYSSSLRGPPTSSGWKGSLVNPTKNGVRSLSGRRPRLNAC